MSECACPQILERETSDKNPGTADQSRWPWGKSRDEADKDGWDIREEGEMWRLMTCAKQTHTIFHHTLEPHVVWPHLEVCRSQCASNVCSATKGTVRATRSVCTHSVVHKVVATTWVRTPCTTEEKSITTTDTMEPAACKMFDGWRLPWPLPLPTVLYTSWSRTCRSCETLNVIFCVQIHEVQNCLHTWYCPCEHSVGRTRTSGLAEDHRWNKVDFSFVCLLFDFFSFLIHYCFWVWSLLCFWVRDPFCTCSRFASVTFLRDFQTLLYQNHGFPMAGITCTPFHLVPHLRAARTLRASGLLEGFVPQSRFPRDEATCTRCHIVKQIRWRAVLRSCALEWIRALISKKLLAFVIPG